MMCVCVYVYVLTMKITIQVGISMYKGGGDTKPLDDIKLFNESLAIIKNISVSPQVSKH